MTRQERLDRQRARLDAPVDKRVIKIRGKDVTFRRRVLKDGTVAFFRGRQRARKRSQIRTAKGVLHGQTLAQAQGRFYQEQKSARKEFPFAQTKADLPDMPHIQKWAAGLAGTKRLARYDWYVLIEVIALDDRPGSGLKFILEDDEEVPSETTNATINVRGNNGLTIDEFLSQFRSRVQAAVERYGLIIPPDKTLDEAIIAVWRHREPTRL